MMADTMFGSGNDAHLSTFNRDSGEESVTEYEFPGQYNVWQNARRKWPRSGQVTRMATGRVERKPVDWSMSV